MRHIDPATIHHSESHRYLLAGVAPRPIAFVGTVDGEGRPNLSPFSFFNAFGANPPVVAFSPANRGSDGTQKHTYFNIRATGEFTVSVVSYSMVEQVSLASGDFPDGIDEFIKAGFTKLPSHKIRPFGVAESPMVMECRLLQYVPLGNGPASGNLMIGEVVMFHIRESAFEGTYLNAERLDLVARMGGPLYCRASGPAVFSLAKPTHPGIGFDALPEYLRTSAILTGNDLAKFAGVKSYPEIGAVRDFWNALLASEEAAVPDAFEIELRVGAADRALAILAARVRGGEDFVSLRDELHRVAQAYLRTGNVERAWHCVLAEDALG
ncbi:MAG TPA: flavin reductase family protein [Candidatus Kapabacteria bacterium]|nr:flavin reductase family protein [Candidatus Kapabacteria bacterium]